MRRKLGLFFLLLLVMANYAIGDEKLGKEKPILRAKMIKTGATGFFVKAENVFLTLTKTSVSKEPTGISLTFSEHADCFNSTACPQSYPNSQSLKIDKITRYNSGTVVYTASRKVSKNSTVTLIYELELTDHTKEGAIYQFPWEATVYRTVLVAASSTPISPDDYNSTMNLVGNPEKALIIH